MCQTVIRIPPGNPDPDISVCRRLQMLDAGLERGDPKRVSSNLQPDAPGLWTRKVQLGRGAQGTVRQSREKDPKGPRSSIIRFVIIQNGTINAMVGLAR